jgi:hypothetical protein
MKPKIAFTFVLIALVLTISALWMQVRALKASVDQLTRNLPAIPSIQRVLIRSPEPDRATEQKKSPFKLIEVSNVGVPWSIEHAMINEGSERKSTLRR